MSLNDYEFLKVLQNEDNNSLLKVKNKKDGQIYMLKNIRFKLLNEQEKKNSINELKILTSLRHPNIIEFKNAFFDEPSNSLNILMEFPTNENLNNKIQYAIENQMYMEECIIWNILTQILHGLKYIHNKGIIHQNLNSKNVYLTKFRLAKIINIGENTYFNDNNFSFTNIKNIFYVAPEILSQKQYSYNCNIWSLGCIIYEMAALSLPFYGDSIESLYNNIMTKKYKPIPDFYSNNLKYIINYMLKIDPSKRPSTLILLDYPMIKETRNQLNQIYSIYIDSNNNLILNKTNNIKNKNNQFSKNNQKRK